MIDSRMVAAAAVWITLFVAAAADAQTPESPERPAKAEVVRATSASARAVAPAPVPVRARVTAEGLAPAARIGKREAAGMGSGAAVLRHQAPPPRPPAEKAGGARSQASGPTSSLDGVIPTLHAPDVHAGATGGDAASRLLRQLRVDVRSHDVPGRAQLAPPPKTGTTRDGGAKP